MRKILLLILQCNLIASAQILPKIFINCNEECYQDYLKTELSYFSFVRDRFESDIELLIIQQDNAIGGKKITVNAIGHKTFQNISDSVTFYTKPSDSPNIIRNQILQQLKFILLPFVKNQNDIARISIDYPKREENQLDSVKDKWNFWVFSPQIIGTGSGGSNNIFFKTIGSFNIRRITNQSKFVFSPTYMGGYSYYKIDDKEISGNWYYYGGDVLYAKTINQHWSVGGFSQTFSNSYENTKISFKMSPVIEYNIFPFSINTYKQLRFAYQIGCLNNQYLDTTIYEKTKEMRPYNKLSIILELNKSWGSVSSSLHYQSLLDKISQYRLGVNNDFTLRLFEGFSFTLSGSLFYVQDQISLRKSNLDENTYLLGLQQLPTSFEYDFEVGFTYTFGSSYNNIVNPRMGSIEWGLN